MGNPVLLVSCPLKDYIYKYTSLHVVNYTMGNPLLTDLNSDATECCYSGTPLFRTSEMRTSRFNGRFALVRIAYPLTAIHYNP